MGEGNILVCFFGDRRPGEALLLLTRLFRPKYLLESALDFVLSERLLLVGEVAEVPAWGVKRASLGSPQNWRVNRSMAAFARSALECMPSKSMQSSKYACMTFSGLPYRCRRS